MVRLYFVSSTNAIEDADELIQFADADGMRCHEALYNAHGTSIRSSLRSSPPVMLYYTAFSVLSLAQSACNSGRLFHSVRGESKGV